MEQRHRSPLRLLAPVAIVAFSFAFLVVLTSADVDDEGNSRTGEEAERRDLGESRERGSRRASTGATETGDVYVVKAGDTLAAIAQRVGLTIERLQQLNPDLDPQALVSGQKIKLRE